MNKVVLTLIFILTFSVNCLSQNLTKKYNEIQQRYEYFDRNGNMTGYEKWNPIISQWEYFDVKTQQNNKREYIQPYDFDILRQGLEYRQNSYNSNVEYIQSEINYIDKKFQLFFNYREVKEIKPFIPRIENLYTKFQNGIVQLNNTKGLDYSRKSTANEVISWLKQFDNALINITNEIQK